MWASFLKQKYIQRQWIAVAKWERNGRVTRREKVKQTKQANVMDDLLDLDFSGFGPEKVRMDDGWNTPNDAMIGERKREKKMEERMNRPLPLFQQQPRPANPPFQPQPFNQQPPFNQVAQPFNQPLPSLPPRADAMMFGGVPSYPPMDYSYPPYPPYPQQSQTISVDYMLSSNPSDLHRGPLPPQDAFMNMPPNYMQQGFLNPSLLPQGMPQQPMPQQPMPQQSLPQQPMPQQGLPQQGLPQQGLPQQPIPQGLPQQPIQPMPQQGLPQQAIQQPIQQPFVPLSPALTAIQPSQPPSVLGQTKVESPTAIVHKDSSKTTIIPLMNPARDVPPPPQIHHQRGLSSVVHNTGLVEDDSTEDEDDYESQIEKNERKTDENVKRKVMNALQSALSDLQLTGIQIKWSDIEVDRRIGVGGFAIVYHGLYR